MPFEKGKSGNAGGRPRKTKEQVEFEEKCRCWAATFAISKLIRAADSDNIKESLAGTMELLNRGFGKPVETNVIEANVTSQTGSSVSELEARLDAIVPIAEGASGSGPDGIRVDSKE